MSPGGYVRCMSRVEEIKAMVDQLTPDERGQLCPYWHPEWEKVFGDAAHERSARVMETPDDAATLVVGSRAKEIKAMIDALSPMEQCELNALVQDWPDDEWDKQMKADAAAGKLDWMIEEAERAAREGTLRDFPPVEEQ
jgi:hypothetical protein